jgi:hypothetical protein
MSVKKGERRRTIADLTNKRYYFEFADMPNADRLRTSSNRRNRRLLSKPARR